MCNIKVYYTCVTFNIQYVIPNQKHDMVYDKEQKICSMKYVAEM